jgi:phage FluMu protein Com
VCEFKAVKCDACGKMVVVSNMDKHKTDECPEAMINCKKCNKAMLKRTIQV